MLMIRGIFQLFMMKNKSCFSMDEAATLEPKSDQAERQWSRLRHSVPLDNPGPWHSCGCSLNHKSHPNIAILMLTAVHDSVHPLACRTQLHSIWIWGICSGPGFKLSAFTLLRRFLCLCALTRTRCTTGIIDHEAWCVGPYFGAMVQLPECTVG